MSAVMGVTAGLSWGFALIFGAGWQAIAILLQAMASFLLIALGASCHSLGPL